MEGASWSDDHRTGPCIIESDSRSKKLPAGSPPMESQKEPRHREGEILYDILYIRNLKRNDTNELTYKAETHSQT